MRGPTRYLPIAALVLCGCLGENQLGGSVSELFPLDVSQVQVLRNDEAIQVNYYANNGPDFDLVIGISVYVADQNVRPGAKIPLGGEYAPGHNRAVVVHELAAEPIEVFADIKLGDLTISRGGDVGTSTQGDFSLSFVTGVDAGVGAIFGEGRDLQGTFSALAGDAGFGSP